MASNMSLADGQATPVAQTFYFASQNGTNYEWMETSSGIYEGFRRIRMDIRPAKSANMGTKIVISVEVPELAVTAPASGTGIQPNPTRAYVTRSKHEFMIPKASTLQNRKHILAFARNVLSNSQVTNALESYINP